MKQYPNVTVLEHPLITHKISILRDKNTPTSEFRQLVKEIAIMEGYEALRNVPTKDVEIETPIEKTTVKMVRGSKLCFVPILRAGMGMVDGLTELIPTARVGHIGLYRDEVTHEPHEYYCKLPNDLENLEIYVIDPMLATGGSAIDAIRLLKEHGAKNLHFICIIAAPEGIKAFCEANPDIPLTVGALDRQLNENAYICPGLGDAGDRIFGTVK
ncbi:MAG: uracil phosphoribosyltransferase [Candidatus Enteromonas sp.]|jgi:uracil phosphoribosyltransferase|nr:uracil phosphoribosyltransferase [Bacilli bacterium]MEE3401570.1 uracil phosphoribosyltransferase [Candidatus Enteromonas sp.]MBQ2052074.1 uracil phosphoribosyltransferase [Bacilli bacterium]MBQ4183304.1 uracil phosphoribosyltransferase [Bacilli bacterium]MEE3426998.1 uracil phosphoribosyltransferase [Candidatus Enteromonas sp.]